MRKGPDELHIVLDQQHRGAALCLHRAQRVCECCRLGGIQTGRRLVEQQQLGLGHERTADFDQPAASQRQRLDGRVGNVVETEQFEGGEHTRLLIARRRREIQDVLPEPPGSQPTPLGHQQMVTNAHPGEQFDALERAADPRSGAAVDRSPGQVAPVERHRTTVGSQHPEEAVEERGLARAVGTDQSDGLTGLHLHRHRIERGDPGEPLGDGNGVEEGHQSAPVGASDGSGTGPRNR